MNRMVLQNKPTKVTGLGAVFLTLVMDLVGFSLFFTIYPDILYHYLPLLSNGAAGVSDPVARWITELSYRYIDPVFLKTLDVTHRTEAILAALGAFLSGIYSLMQFFFSPLWGMISDRIGRKRALQISITGNMLSYILWAATSSFTAFLISRFFAGLCSGNISVASAAISDLTDEKNRTMGMGMVGMAVGIGFVLGPPLGGLLNLWRLDFFPANPFFTIAFFGALISMLNFIYVSTRFPYIPVIKKGPRSAGGLLRIVNLAMLKYERDYRKGYKVVLGIHLLTVTAFAAFEATMVFYFAWHLGFDRVDRIYLFAYTGILLAFVQGGLSRRLSGRVLESRQIIVGTALFMPGFLIYALSMQSGVVVALGGLTMIVFAAGMLFPPLSAQASLLLADHVQGMGLGIYRSFGALGRILGPFYGGAVYLLYGQQTLFLSCFVLAAVLVVLSMILRRQAGQR